MKQHRHTLIFLPVMIVVLLAGVLFPVSAQDAPVVTDDEVNDIASGLYCPVCENIPLDVCPTQACIDWREEIRTQLAAGSNRQQIIDGFVARYGERVVGTPQDPMLRALSLLTPWVIGLLVLVVGINTFVRWRRQQQTSPLTNTGPYAPELSDAYYRQRLESDLKERR
jgi:cytochrome c-type biogenesis protein CcmH